MRYDKIHQFTCLEYEFFLQNVYNLTCTCETNF